SGFFAADRPCLPTTSFEPACLSIGALPNESYTDRRAPALAGRLRRRRLTPEKTRLQRARPAKGGALRSLQVFSAKGSLKNNSAVSPDTESGGGSDQFSIPNSQFSSEGAVGLGTIRFFRMRIENWELVRFSRS